MKLRRSAGMLAALVAAGAMASLAVTPASAEKLPLPASPVAINIIDVGGALALTQKAFEAYQKANPKVVSRFTFNKGPAPELSAKLRAMQNAGRVDLDLVLTGLDGLAAGMGQQQWTRILPDHAEHFPSVPGAYPPEVQKLNEMVGGFGLMVTYSPLGPLLEYMPDRVKSAPRTPAELLAYCKQNPGRFIYARPANSGPARTFVMGLPYLLGDKDPRDPVNGWANTWAYLKELDSCIEYYPSGTTATMKELGEGSRDMTVTITGWDINPRFLGIVPKEAKIGVFDNFTWVGDGHYMAVPKGISKEKLAVVLDIMNYLLQPAQQALTYDEGYFYPGPAVKGVTLEMAPKESQDVIREFGRPEYAELFAKHPIQSPLDAEALVAMFARWDKDIGSRKAK